jgi:hypothetical protein
VRGDAGAKVVENATLNGTTVKTFSQHILVTDEKLVFILSKLGSLSGD